MKQGFTIIELSLYMALAAVVLGAVVGIQVTLDRARIKHEVISEVEGQATQVLQYITYTVRNAQTITSPSTSSSGGSLVVTPFDSALDPITITESGGVIAVCEGAGCTPIPLTSPNITISDLAFENLARPGTSSSIRIHFTATYTDTTGRNEYAWSNTYYASATVRQP